jgi:hypothetical protein
VSAAPELRASVHAGVLERLDRLFDTRTPYKLWIHQPHEGAARAPRNA